MRDLIHDLGGVHLMDAQDITNHTDVASSWLDLSGFEGGVISVNFGTVTNTDANNKVLPVLQESDTTAAADATAVAAADMQGAYAAVVSAATDQLTQAVGYIGNKRYIRVNLDFTSAGANPDHCPVSIDGVVGHGRRRPVTSPAAVAAT